MDETFIEDYLTEKDAVKKDLMEQEVTQWLIEVKSEVLAFRTKITELTDVNKSDLTIDRLITILGFQSMIKIATKYINKIIEKEWQ